MFSFYITYLIIDCSENVQYDGMYHYMDMKCPISECEILVISHSPAPHHLTQIWCFHLLQFFFFFFKSLQCSTFSGHLSHMLHVHHDLFAKPVYIMLCRIFNSAKSKNLLFFYFKLLFQSVAFPLRRKLKMHIEMHFIVTIWKTADLALLTLPQWF